MYWSYLTIAIRNLKRNLTSSLINILGLASGLTVGILLYSYVLWENSYDEFYPENQRIYRISYTKFLNGSISEPLAKSPAALANTIREELPEVKVTTQVYPTTEATISIGETRFNEDQVFWVDADFVEVFSLPLLYGTTTGDGVLISESIAKKYFAYPQDAINQSIEMLGEDHALSNIAGVFKDLPENTHFNYEILFVQDEDEDDVSWQWTGVYTYVLLHDGTAVDRFEKRLNNIVAARSKGVFEANVTTQVKLQPLTDIHLYSHLQEEIEPNGSYQIIVLLVLIGILVLMVAGLNSVNIHTAQAMDRAKEVGIRKILGIDRGSLIRQFIVEAALYSFISISVALAVGFLLVPYFAHLSGKPLSWAILLADEFFWMGVGGVFLTTTVAFALYPSLLLASVEPVRAIKGVQQFPGQLFLRKGLITFQFAATTFVMITVLILYKQLQFMKEHDLGMNISQLVVVKAPNIEKEAWSDAYKSYVINAEYRQMAQRLKEKLESFASMKVTSVSHVPGSELVWGTEGFRREGSLPDDIHFLHMQGIDHQFLDVFEVNLLAGRNFSESHTTDQFSTVLLNEAALITLGFPNANKAVGNHLVFYDGSKKLIIGVVKDFHQEALQKAIKPTFYELLPRALDYLVVKIPGQQVARSLSTIQAQWNSVFPTSPFEYFFLDDFYHRHYHDELQFFRVSSTFMLLCMVIASIGLFGLSVYIISRRTKEISIRKVLGASVSHLTFMLVKGQLLLSLIGFLLAAPIAYFLLDNWLSDYAYRTEWQWWVFAFPLLVLVVLSVLTVGSQSLKQALSNPVDTLRNE